jgi:diguanylate cyclase (GGDEF)-like protein
MHDEITVYSPTRIDLSAFADSHFAQQLGRSFWSLRLPVDLERQFLEFHLLQVRSRVQAFFIILLLIEIYRMISVQLTSVTGAVSLSGILQLLFVLAGVAISWSRWYWRLYLPSARAISAIVFTAFSYFLPLSPGDGDQQVMLFALSVPLSTYLLLGLPFLQATVINALSLVAFIVSAVSTSMATPDMISTISWVVTTTTVAACLAYTAERSTRAHFLQERLLGEIATRDGLTGLQNRGAFDAHLERLWKQAQRKPEPIALLLLDVDHFKGFNDTLGHQAGDACLRQVATIFNGYARRPLDLAARYGGEEFAIILFQTPPEQVRAIAEAVRAAVEALGVPNPAAPRKVVTVSCGVAAVTPAQGRSMHGLVQLADEALYEAKANGRNCVQFADSEKGYAAMATGRFRPRSHLRAVS